MIVGPPLHVSTSTTVNLEKVAHSQILQGYILDKCKHQKWSHELKRWVHISLYSEVMKLVLFIKVVIKIYMSL